VTVIGRAASSDREDLRGTVQPDRGEPLVIADQDFDSLLSHIQTSKSMLSVGLILALLGGELYWGWLAL
jgi:hypothetical protein